MHRFLHDVLKPIFGDRVKLLYMDPDSFVLSFELKDDVSLDEGFIDTGIVNYLDASEYH